MQQSQLKQNGYRILKGKVLKNMKLAQVDDMHVVDLIGAKVPTLACLAELSDALIPHLISGQFRLPETFDNQGLTTT